MSCVYKIVSKETGDFYIGSTVDLAKRIRAHEYNLRKGQHHSLHMQQLYDHGCEFEIFILAEGNREEMLDFEQVLLDREENNIQLLNVARSVKGGDNLTNNPRRQDIINRMTESVIKRYDNYTEEDRRRHSERTRGERNGMYGHTHTPEVREILSKVHTGHTRNRGRKLSPEQIKGMSERGKTWVGDKNPFYGKTHSEETRRILSEKNRGKPSPTRKSISIEGVIYPSQSHAAKALNVAEATITYRLKSKSQKYAEYRRITGDD